MQQKEKKESLFGLYVWLYRKKLFVMLFSDEAYIKYKFKRLTGRYPDLKNPVSFTEKLNWLKLYWRNPLLTTCADKYEARNYVASKGLGHLLKKLYGVYDNPRQINLDALPTAFVLKVNHGTKQNILCEDKACLDWPKTVALLNFYLKFNNYYKAREWSYKNILPRILCEEHLTAGGRAMTEYNFYCYDGVPKFVEILHADEAGKASANTFDLDFKPLDRTYRKPPLPFTPARTPEYEKLLDYASTLAAGFPFVRVDLFVTGGKTYFGEMTFYPLSGLVKFTPASFDYLLGSFLFLPPPLD